MRIYLVGGAVRDAFLEMPVLERDWVVVGGSPEEMVARGLRPVEGDFPVFIDPANGDEYALARRERKCAPGHKGFVFEADPAVTIEEDLRRRDLTVNAIAQAADGTLIDPFGGRADLESRVLRHVSPAFVEDPLRLLRAARFAARLAHLGFSISYPTQTLLKRMAASGELATLPGERVWMETRQALDAATPARFFEILRHCGAMDTLMPELADALGPVPAHGSDGASAGGRALAALVAVAAVSEDAGLRFAVFLGAAQSESRGTGQKGRELIASLCRRLRIPAADRELVELVVDHTGTLAAASAPEALLRLLEVTDAFRRRQRFERFLVAAGVLLGVNGAQCRARAQGALRAASGVSATTLVEAGFRGPALGAELRRLRLARIILERIMGK